MKKLLLVLAIVTLLFPVTAHAEPAHTTRIQFPSGATHITLTNQTVGANATTDYILAAGQRQVMNVQILGGQNLAVVVYGVNDGVVFVGSSQRLTSWTGNLTLTQDYVIQVVNLSNVASTYALKVSVAARISFTSGTTYGVVRGYLAPGQTLEYSVRASEAQLMTVSLWDLTETILINVTGLDGTVLLTSVNSGTATLPKSQDYIVQVVNADTAPSAFTMQVLIPRHIRFARGSTYATIAGYVDANYSNEYRLYALAGQTMTVTITSTYNDVGLTIVGDDGIPLKRYVVAPLNTWTGVLPASQTYSILATSINPTYGVSYSLFVSIL